MKKLILTSAGFSNKTIVDKFNEMLDKPISEAKVLFIPTASRYQEELEYVKQSRLELINVGINEGNIIEYNLDIDLKISELNKYDILYVCGGNTFYLLHKIKEIKFDEKIRKAVENGLMYIGVSAGSIVVGPTIETAGPFDENDIGIENFKGMNFIEDIIIPHYNEKRIEIVEGFRKTMKNNIITITDNQALIVCEDTYQIIGE